MTEKGSVCSVSNGCGFCVLYTHHLSSSRKEEEGKKEEGRNGGILGRRIPYDYTMEVTNRFKGLALIDYLKNYGQKFTRLYRRH